MPVVHDMQNLKRFIQKQTVRNLVKNNKRSFRFIYRKLHKNWRPLCNIHYNASGKGKSGKLSANQKSLHFGPCVPRSLER